MTRHPLWTVLEGGDVAAAVLRIGEAAPFAAPPAEGADWRERVARRAGPVFADWAPDCVSDETVHIISYSPVGAAVVRAPAFFARPEEVAAWLAPLPIELASFKHVLVDPRREQRERPTPGFGGAHASHGWGCAFRGAGHARLVSRRWLEHGPWRLHRAPGDTSLVQFHDLDVDVETARAQWQAGHARMDEGMIARGDGVEVRGLYDPPSRSLRIVVPPGRRVPLEEMAAACRARREGTPDRPIDAVAYVFIEPADAREQRRELWLRELECWTFRDGAEVHLDEA